MFLFQILTLVSDKAIIDLIDNLGVSPASGRLSVPGSPINMEGGGGWRETKCEMQWEVWTVRHPLPLPPGTAANTLSLCHN